MFVLEKKMVFCDSCDSYSLFVEDDYNHIPVKFSDDETVDYFYCKICQDNNYKNGTAYKQGHTVYFIKDKHSGCIKIGFTRDIEKRLSAINTSNSGEIELLFYVPGDQKKEKNLHKMFSIYRKKGEWFYPCKELLGYIKSEKRKMNPLGVGLTGKCV